MERKSEFNIGNGIWGLLMLVVGFVALWFIAKSVFTVLAWAAPFLLLGAVLINYKTVLSFARFVLQMLKRNVLMGIVAIILMIFGFPIVAGFLFGKALLDRKIVKLQTDIEQKREGEFVEYEEVEEVEEVEIVEETLELPPMEKADPHNEYEDLFDEPSK